MVYLLRKLKRVGGKILQRDSDWFQQKILLNLFRIGKRIHQLFKVLDGHRKTILFITGCQRSGTTLAIDIFERDLNTRVYGEFSKVFYDYSQQNKLRIKALSSVKEVIDGDRVPLVVLKPLVESQNLLKLLNYFQGSRALWMYRHYKDVASSNLKFFGAKNGIDNLRPIVENKSGDWRVENISEDTRATVLDHFSEDMDPYDAAALFWFVRNSLFFELNYVDNPNVIMCRYDDLIRNPFRIMKRIYEFIGCDFPGEKIITQVYSSSVGKGKCITLSSKVDLLCMNLLKKLDGVYEAKNYYAE
jgi:hypothetical protein